MKNVGHRIIAVILIPCLNVSAELRILRNESEPIPTISVLSTQSSALGFASQALAVWDTFSPRQDLLGAHHSGTTRRHLLQAGAALAIGTMLTKAVHSLFQPPVVSASDSVSPREFIDSVLKNHAGGIAGFIAEHEDLHASVNRYPEPIRETFKERLAQMYVLVMYFRNGGFCGYQMSKRGTVIENFIRRRIGQIPQWILPGFLLFPETTADNIRRRLPGLFQTLPRDEAQRFQLLFGEAVINTVVTPFGAYNILGSTIRAAGISDRIRLVMRKKDLALLLHVELDDQHALFIHLDESSMTFDVQNVGQVVDPSLGAFQGYETMQSYVDNYYKPDSDREPGRIAKPIRSLATFFLDLKFFSAVNEVLAPGIFQKDQEMFYALPVAEQRRLVDLKNIHTSLDIRREGVHLLVQYAKRVIEQIEQKSQVRETNLVQKVKEFQAEAEKEAKRVSDYLQQSEAFEQRCLAQPQVRKKYGVLFADLRVAVGLLHNISINYNAASLELSKAIKDKKLGKKIRQRLLIDETATNFGIKTWAGVLGGSQVSNMDADGAPEPFIPNEAGKSPGVFKKREAGAA